jgi:hypothetical protein
LGTNNFVTILELANAPAIQNPGKPWSPVPPVVQKKASSSARTADEGEIETFTILYVTPDGFLPPVALALIRTRDGRLIMAQGEDSEHLKIGREVYLRRMDDFYLFTVKSQLQKVQESLKKLLGRKTLSPSKGEDPVDNKL